MTKRQQRTIDRLTGGVLEARVEEDRATKLVLAWIGGRPVVCVTPRGRVIDSDWRTS